MIVLYILGAYAVAQVALLAVKQAVGWWISAVLARPICGGGR